MRFDAVAAMAALPRLLSRAAPAQIGLLANNLERLLTASGPLDEAAQKRLHEVEAALSDAMQQPIDVAGSAPNLVETLLGRKHDRRRTHDQPAPCAARKSNIDASAGAVAEVERIVARIRSRWPEGASCFGPTRASPARP